MTELHKVPYYQLTALLILSGVVSLYSLNLALGVIIAGLIIIPEFLYSFLATKVLASNSAKLAKAIRLRFLKLLTTIVFLALSIKILSNFNAEVAIAWILTLAVLIMLPLFALLGFANSFKDKTIKVQ